MKLLVDMNLSPRWIEYLKQSGFDAVHWGSKSILFKKHPIYREYLGLTVGLRPKARVRRPDVRRRTLAKTPLSRPALCERQPIDNPGLYFRPSR
jgi:hypothetical protein